MEIDLYKDISSKAYPLTHRWLRVEILKKLSGSFIVIGATVLENYFGSPGIFMQFLFTLDLIIFILLGFIAAVSVVAFLGILQTLWLYLGFEYAFTSMGIEYRTNREQSTTKFLSYNSIKEVMIKRGLLDRIFGYAVLWINPPPWRQRLYFMKEAGSSLAIRGLTKNDAVYILEFIEQKTFSRVPNQPF